MRVRCYLLLGGLSPGPALLSGFDRLSAPDRRSPTSCFSASDRVSVPDRRSFEVRLSSPDRFSSLPIVVSVGLPRIMLDRAGLSHESRPLGLGYCLSGGVRGIGRFFGKGICPAIDRSPADACASGNCLRIAAAARSKVRVPVSGPFISREVGGNP